MALLRMRQLTSGMLAKMAATRRNEDGISQKIMDYKKYRRNYTLSSQEIYLGILLQVLQALNTNQRGSKGKIWNIP